MEMILVLSEALSIDKVYLGIYLYVFINCLSLRSRLRLKLVYILLHCHKMIDEKITFIHPPCSLLGIGERLRVKKLMYVCGFFLFCFV